MIVNRLYIEHKNAAGALLNVINDMVDLSYGRKECELGSLELVLPDDSISFSKFDTLEVYKVYADGVTRLDLEATWFVYKWEYIVKPRVDMIRVYAMDNLMFALIRTLPYASNTLYMSKLGFLDDMMKDLVNENLGVGALDVNRSLAAYISIQAKMHASLISFESFNRNMYLLDALTRLATSSVNAGIYLSFDFVKSGSGFEFRTYAGQRGVNRGSTGSFPLIFTPGNELVDAIITYDYNEKTYCYAYGRGEGIDTPTAEVASSRVSANVFNRVECFSQAADSDDSSYLQQEAIKILNQNRPRIIVSATLVDTETAAYGIDYSFGDIVSVLHRSIFVNCHVNAVGFAFNKGKCIYTAKLVGEILL